MARGVNKVILIGRLGQDPELREAGATKVVNVSLATTDSWRDKANGETKERTEWHRLVFFARQAEVVAQYLRKGAQVYIEGRLQTRKWNDKEGVERYTTEVIVSEMQMLDSKGGQAGADMPAQQGGFEPHAQSTHAQSAQAAASQGMSAQPAFNEDDIPF